MVRELVRQKPDVIVAVGPALASLKQATATIPIVMTAALDPVEMGLVPNLVWPGGNLTGLSLQAIEATAKRLQLLKEVVPGAEPVAVVWHQSSVQSWRAAERAAKARGWPLSSFEIQDSAHGKVRSRAPARRAPAACLCLPLKCFSPAPWPLPSWPAS